MSSDIIRCSPLQQFLKGTVTMLLLYVVKTVNTPVVIVINHTKFILYQVEIRRLPGDMGGQNKIIQIRGLKG